MIPIWTSQMQAKAAGTTSGCPPPSLRRPLPNGRERATKDRLQTARFLPFLPVCCTNNTRRPRRTLAKPLFYIIFPKLHIARAGSWLSRHIVPAADAAGIPLPNHDASRSVGSDSFWKAFSPSFSGGTGVGMRAAEPLLKAELKADRIAGPPRRRRNRRARLCAGGRCKKGCVRRCARLCSSRRRAGNVAAELAARHRVRHMHPQGDVAERLKALVC